MCAAGPPKAVKPSRKKSQKTSASAEWGGVEGEGVIVSVVSVPGVSMILPFALRLTSGFMLQRLFQKSLGRKRNWQFSRAGRGVRTTYVSTGSAENKAFARHSS